MVWIEWSSNQQIAASWPRSPSPRSPSLKCSMLGSPTAIALPPCSAGKQWHEGVRTRQRREYSDRLDGRGLSSRFGRQYFVEHAHLAELLITAFEQFFALEISQVFERPDQG